MNKFNAAVVLSQLVKSTPTPNYVYVLKDGARYLGTMDKQIITYRDGDNYYTVHADDVRYKMA